jgi:hypothetical protein
VQIRTIHAFIASFASENDAQTYSQPQWEPEPDADASDEDYAAWEDRNPQCRMKNDLGIVYLDEDFVETIWGVDGSDAGANWAYLASFIGDENAAVCRTIAAGKANTLILIDEQAAGGFPVSFRSTPATTYCGPFGALP